MGLVLVFTSCGVPNTNERSTSSTTETTSSESGIGEGETSSSASSDEGEKPTTSESSGEGGKPTTSGEGETSSSESSGSQTGGQTPTDYGTLTIADVSVDYQKTANIVPVFSKNAEEIVYSFNGNDISITGNVVTGNTANAVVVVTATTEHLSTTFTVTVSAQTYKIKINYEGAPSSVTPYEQSFEEGQSYSVTSPVFTGYTADKALISGSATQDVTTTVTYTANPYTVSYDYNGGRGVANPTSVVYDSAFGVVSPTRAGYKFSGWQVEGVNTATALYGSYTAQTNGVLSELSYCYQKNSADKSANGSDYWSGDVYFKNLTAASNGQVTLKATWTSLSALSDTVGGAIVNNAAATFENGNVIDIAKGLKGDFTLKFSFYQNAVIGASELSYAHTASKTGILGMSVHGKSDYVSYLRQDAYLQGGTYNAGTRTVSPSSYSQSNDYGEMFYGLIQNNYSSSSTKFANFVKNSIVTYTVKGYKVGNAGGYLEITQTIKSLSTLYRNQEISIVYDVNLTDGVYFNNGIDFCVKAENTELSLTDISLVVTEDGYSYCDTTATSYDSLVLNYSHYAPDRYWTGDFDFTISYDQTQSNYYSEWGDTCYRTGYVVFYEWGNPSENVALRNDWWSQISSSGKFSISNDNFSVGEFDTFATGKFTSYGGSREDEMRLYRNASVSVRCIRTGNTVIVYQFVSYPGSTYVTLFNGYKFTTTVQNLSFQVAGLTSGITITYDTYSANTKVLAGASLNGTSYGLSTYSFSGDNDTRAHMAIPFPVKAGTVVRYKGSNDYRWSVLELSAYLGARDNVNHEAERLFDTTWQDPATVRSYTISRDCYIAVNIRYANDASLSSVNILELLKASFEIQFEMPNNLNGNEKVFTTSMLQDNSTYGLTTYSGTWGEANTRCHVAIVPLIKKGTVITFNGGTAYRWSVLEMANERDVLFDTTWQDPATVTSYTVKRDCYVAINVKYASEASMENANIKDILYNNISVEGKCGVVICQDYITHSTTETGDMNSVSHRGYSATAPENTTVAYSVSKSKGYTKVECDINFTSDGYAVLIHDGTIDRTTGNAGTGHVNTHTLADVRNYDFGSWKGSAYANVQIPTIEEFLVQCRNLSLHPYLELKDGTKAQIQRLALIVRRYGMEEHVTWISFSLDCLKYIRDVSPKARLGYLFGPELTPEEATNRANSLKTGQNEVFFDIGEWALNDATYRADLLARCKANGIPLECWTVNDEQRMKDIYNATGGYVTGFTSDNIIAENVNFG